MYDYGPILIRLKNCKKASNLTNEELSSLSGVPPSETIVEPAIIFAGGLLGIVLPRPVE